MPCNYIKKALHTKQGFFINLNNCLSTANNIHIFINKETALEKLAIDAQALFTTLSPDSATSTSDK